MSDVKLGMKARDVVTGYSGIVTGICHHLTGCDTVGLQPPAKEGEKIQAAHWFDINRIEVLEAESIVLPGGDISSETVRVGGPQPTPQSTSNYR